MTSVKCLSMHGTIVPAWQIRPSTVQEQKEVYITDTEQRISQLTAKAANQETR